MRGQPIVDAKISKPLPHRWAPSRARAQALLDQGDQGGLAIVAAGPGYFKRQLVEAWATLDPRRRVAWLSLDEADDPIRLLAHALAAVRSAAPGFAPEIVLDELPGPGNWHARAADAVMEALGTLDEPLTLVIEGVHRLRDPDSRRGVETLVRYRPNQFKIIVITRDDAAIDLAHDTMSGAVTELREPDLALDVDETFRLLAAAGLDVTLADARSLHAATGGWPAGVSLTAGRRTSDGEVPPFAPDEEPVQGYLRNRVLDPLDDELATFFLQVASLGSVHPGLAGHVTGRPDARRRLDRLTELHLLFEAPGLRPGWRCFPDYLRRFAHHELRARNEDDARELCRRGATWCWERELLEESLTIAAYGEDVDLLAAILLEHHLPWSAGGEADRVRAWSSVLLQMLPDCVEAHLASAWASLLAGDDVVAASTVAFLGSRTVPGRRGDLVAGELDVLRAHLARGRGELTAALALARRGADAASRLGPDFTTLYGGALPSAAAMHVGMAAVWAGELDEAIAELESARSTWGWASQSLPLLHGYLGLAHWLLGDEAAVAHAGLARTHLQERQLGAGDVAAVAIGLLLGLSPATDTDLAALLDLAEAIGEPVIEVLAAACEAMVHADRDPGRARRAVRRGREAADACAEPGVLPTLMAKVAFVVGVDSAPVLGDPLTEGEQRVLWMLAGPLTEREIAAELHLSHNTVRTYRRRLYGKLGLSSRADVGGAIEAVRRQEGS